MRRLSRRAAAAGIAVLLAASAAPAQAMTAPGASRPARPARAAGVRRPAPASAASQARLAPLRLAQRQAKATGRAVTVASQTTPTSVTVAQPDGQFATTASVLPVRVRRGGAWVRVSAVLHRTAGGYRPAAIPSGLTLSAGGRGPLAVLTDASGRRLAFSVPFGLPTPRVSGDTATYRGVRPGVDLVVTVSSQGGFSDVLVARNAAAAANPALRRLRLATAARGLRVAAGARGNLTATAPGGRAEFTGSNVETADAGAPIAGATGAAAVSGQSVSPTTSSTVGYVETQQGCPTYENFNSSSVTTEGVGYQDFAGDACQGLYRSFFQLKTTNLNSSMVISKATLLLQETYGADEDCSDTWPVTLYWTAGIGASTDWNTKPSVESTIATTQVKSAWCSAQDVSFNVLAAMQKTAANNYTQWTFGLYGDETKLGYSACSPSTEYNCGFMRFADNPSVTTVFDITPAVPTNTTTTPAPQIDAATATGCGSGPVGWIGQTDLGANNGSEVTLDAAATSNITGENVRAQYTLWDNSATSAAADTDVVAQPDSLSEASGTTFDTPVGITLQDGHQYAWTVDAYDGILTSADAPVCTFDVDLTAPTLPLVSSTAFPPAGADPASVPTVGTTGSFTLSSSDLAPAGCAATCLSSGLAGYEYSFNSPLPASGATVQAGAAISFTPTRWGTNILYVAAVDNAGNVSQTAQYDFYVAFAAGSSPVHPGDVNGDGVPDLLATTTAGNLALFSGGADPALAPQLAGTAATSPDSTGWNTFQIAHRGSMSGGDVDDLFAHKGANLYLYLNNSGDPGAAPQFGNQGDVNPIAKPSCAATASDAGNCTGYDATDWSDVTAMLAPGDVYGSGLPDLLTVENDQLWLYKGGFGDSLSTPVLLGSSGWSGMTLIAPGQVGGTLTLWARDNATGTIYSYPLTLDSGGVPELGTASVGVPVTATSGTLVGGITLTAAAYPVVASVGALTSGTCSAAGTACPGLYAEDTSGSLWYYQGEPATGGASPVQAGSPVLVGTIDDPSAQWTLADGRGTTATDATGNGRNGTLTGTTWVTDPARGTVVSFNGTSSSLQLPNDLVEKTTAQSWSMWFKTITPGGVLLSTGTSPIGTTSPSTAAVPLLYVGTDGHLYGQFWTGQVGPMSSTGAVDDGTWHHVVITANSTSQSLYLDGTQIGAVPGTVANADPLDFVGAGYVNTSGWVKAPASGWNYFNGEVSDVEYYAYPVAPSEVAATENGQGPLDSGLG